MSRIYILINYPVTIVRYIYYGYIIHYPSIYFQLFSIWRYSVSEFKLCIIVRKELNDSLGRQKKNSTQILSEKVAIFVCSVIIATFIIMRKDLNDFYGRKRNKVNLGRKVAVFVCRVQLRQNILAIISHGNAGVTGYTRFDVSNFTWLIVLGKAKINQAKEMKCNTANNKFKSRYKNLVHGNIG